MELKLMYPSPALLRVIADQLAVEEAAEKQRTAERTGFSRAGLMAAAQKLDADGVERSPGNEPISTTQLNPLGNEGSAFAAPAPKKRGRPAKNPELNAETPDPEILPEAPAPVPVNPVVTMPNGVVLNAPVAAAPAEVSALPPLAQVVADYAKAFQIAGLSALAKREGVTKFSELPEERQTTLKREMLDAISLGVAAA